MAVRNDFTAGEVLAAADLNDTFGAKLDLAGGKILQIVRATDGTQRSTSSTSFVDASISVTITPQKNDSAVILIWAAEVFPANNGFIRLRITDNDNNPIGGSEGSEFGGSGVGSATNHISTIGFATPGTTSATTFKGRFLVNTGTGILLNTQSTGQLYAIEVSA
jgi:hypothetical protein